MPFRDGVVAWLGLKSATLGSDRMRQTKCMDDVFAAQEAGVRSAMR